MNLEEQLLFEHSKANTQRITSWIGQDPDRFAELMSHFLGETYRLVQRSAWVVSEVGTTHPHLLQPYQTVLLDALEKPLHDAVLRNGLKFIADTGFRFSEDEEGRLVQLAFELIASPKTAIAIRVHALQVVANLCASYPELAIELTPFIQEGLEEDSAGMRSRCKRISKQLQRLDGV